MEVGKHAYRDAKLRGATPKRIDARVIEHRLGLGPRHDAEPTYSALLDPVVEFLRGVRLQRVDNADRHEAIRITRSRIGDVAVVVPIRAEGLHQDRAIHAGAIHQG